MAKTTELATKQPELQDVIDALEQYQKQLFDAKAVSRTAFSHMQVALHGAKNIVRDLYGAPRKRGEAWVK